jgi:hypothetical protein
MRNGKFVKSICGVLACAATATAGWSPPETVSPPGNAWATCYNFANAIVADDAGNLHVVFFQEKGAAAYYRRFDRAAGRWDPPQRLDETGGRDAALVAGSGGELHAFFKASGGALGHRVGDAGGNWGPCEYLTVADYRLGFPSPLLLPSGDVALAMVGERKPAGPAYIWFTTWRRDARRFDTPVRLSDTTGALGSWMPTLASFRGRLRLAWRDDSTGEFELYERTRDAARWSPVRRLTFDPAPTYHPRYAVDGGGPLRLVFMDRRRGRPAIWEMDDEGGGWGREYVLFDGGGEAYHPNVALIPGGGLLLFWEDARGAAHKEIYFATLRNDVWSAAARVTSSPATDSGCPSAAVTAGGEIAVVYAETGKGIQVRRLPLGEAPVGGVTFRAAPARLGVKLSWAGQNLALFSSFNLYRKSAAEPAWHLLNASPIAGRAPFSYYDEPPAPGEYVYKLEGKASPGEGVTLGSAAATVGRTRPPVAEMSVRPNPCRGVCYISWGQGQPAAAAVAVYDIMGRCVRKFAATGAAGPNELAFEVGGLAPGCYVAVVAAGGARARATFVVTR